MALFGYTSCSLSKNVALSFTNDEEQSRKKAVLYQIEWTKGAFAVLNCYILDATVSSYENEKEVLIFDGFGLFIDSIEEETINGKNLTIINLKAS